MKEPFDRRKFLKIAGTSIGVGALFQVTPLLGQTAAGRRMVSLLGKKNGEAPTPFSFVQLSDTHVGFLGPPNPNGTQAFERAIDLINGLPRQPELVLFTGDLTHDSENPGEHADRMRKFQQIAGRLRAPLVRYVPGEHDAGLDGGKLFRDTFGDSHYSFDHRGVHFIALDNVSLARPNVGPEQLAWLGKDLARFPKTAPIVVFTHRPLFDLRPDWEWFTGDGDEVMNLLAPYENVTVLYGHIHREHSHTEGHATHLAARRAGPCARGCCRSRITESPTSCCGGGAGRKPCPIPRASASAASPIRCPTSRKSPGSHTSVRLSRAHSSSFRRRSVKPLASPTSPSFRTTRSPGSSSFLSGRPSRASAQGCAICACSWLRLRSCSRRSRSFPASPCGCAASSNVWPRAAARAPCSPRVTRRRCA